MAQRPTIITRPASVDDAEAISAVHYAALAHYHDFYAAFFKNHPRVIIPQANLAALRDPENRFVVAIDTASQDIVGFIRYRIVEADQPGVPATAAPALPDKGVEKPSPSLFDAKEHLGELCRKFGQPREYDMDACYEVAADGQRHLYIKHLMVDPGHQRKGIGATLLSGVNAISDAEQIPSFLVSSAEACRLYSKLGFEELGTWTINNAYWSREIVDLERKLEIPGNEMLAEQYREVKEIESYMVRWPVQQ